MITEQVFSLTGIGSYALNAMQQGDIPVIMTYNCSLPVCPCWASCWQT